jgi:soluble lytic murein transglycosylase
MSPPAATVTARRSGRRRAAARRRRRMVGSITAVSVLALTAALTMPLFRRAVTDLTLPLSYSDVIRQQAAAKQLDPALIAGVIYTETKFDPRPSSAGAVGLMQILPQTAEFLARRSGATTFTIADLGTPQVNIAYGSYYLRYLLDEYGGQQVLALAAYNGGESNVNRWIAQQRQEGRQLTLQEIPFPETRAYVAKVLKAQQDYRRTYPGQLGYP